jgi:sugar fermentation stimulation protein A
VNFSSPLVPAKFQKREKRFFAHCQLSDGTPVIAHCANSGSMRGNLEVGADSWLLDFGPDHAETGKKLRYKWMITKSAGVRVVIDTHLANKIVEEGILAGKVRGCSTLVEREKTWQDSRFDFFFPDSGGFLEVKSVSMGAGANASFPDAVTERGQKHLRDLMELKKSGKPAKLLFLIMREGVKKMRIAAEIDPEYARLVKEALACGVEILVYTIKIQEHGVSLGEEGELLCK